MPAATEVNGPPRLSRDGNPQDPALDMALSGDILAAVAARRSPATIRVFAPGPTVAFGRRDKLRPGFATASAVAVAHGYAPLVRHAGGHAVIYDANSVIVEVLRPEEGVIGDLEGRFSDLSELISETAAQLGVALELGELPDEYCPGRFSLHLPNGAKVAGIAQRIIKDASLTTAVLTVAATDSFRALTAEIYGALGLKLDAATVGAITDRFPDIAPRAVADALAESAARRYGAIPSAGPLAVS